MTEDKVYNVLFLCSGNAVRSIMAECILNRLGQGRFKAYSGGSTPKGAIHPKAEHYLHLENYKTEGMRSKHMEEFTGPDAPQMDFVFTVCDKAAEVPAPVWPGQPLQAHWGIPDPTTVLGTETEINLAFADTMRFLNNRISIFVNLPIHALDKLALQVKLDDIGKSSQTSDSAAV